MGKHVVKELLCEMTAKEKAGKSELLASAISFQQELEDERKAFLEDWKRRRIENDRRVLRLAREVRTGHEPRQVLCEETLRTADGKVDVHRLDSGQLVCTRDLERSDVQTSLAIDVAPSADLVH